MAETKEIKVDLLQENRILKEALKKAIGFLELGYCAQPICPKTKKKTDCYECWMVLLIGEGNGVEITD